MENFRLKVFRLVGETLNFRRAAEELHLTQPAVTAQIKALEDTLGLARRIGHTSPSRRQRLTHYALHRAAP